MWTKNFIALFLFVTLTGYCADVSKSDNKFPFYPGERLRYKIKWGYIPAGEVVFEVKPLREIDGVLCHHFTMTATTNAFVSKIYKVRDFIESFVDEDMTHSILYRKKQQEGRHHRDVVIIFDWEKQHAQYSNYGKSKPAIPIGLKTFDPLSVLYQLRCQEFVAGTTFAIPITDGKSNISGRVNVVKKQMLKTSFGKRESIMVEPELKQVRGVFKRSKKAKLRVWFGTDSRALPLKFSSIVIVGAFTAELIGIE